MTPETGLLEKTILALLNPEFVKIIGYILVYPFVVVYTTIKIAKWHFEKDTRKQYLGAKDAVANELNNAISNTLIAMWKLAHTQKLIESGILNKEDPAVGKSIQESLNEVQKNTLESYPHLGRAGLYFGTNIVEKVSQFQSELNNMIFNQDYSAFNNPGAWDDYRRKTILPVIQVMHDELKSTVFGNNKSFCNTNYKQT